MKNLVILIIFTILLNACSTVLTSGSRVPVEDKSTEADISPENIEDENLPIVQDDHTDTLAGPESDETPYIEEQPEDSAATFNKTDTSPAVLALLADAESYSNAGKQEHAAAQLERGIRIEPNNPFLWNKLAELRLQQEKWMLAVSMAQKSNTLSRGNRQLQAYNWKIIAFARQALGDKQGAQKAYAKSVSLSSGNFE